MIALAEDDNIKKIGDEIANLTLAEAKELSQYLEEVHGIKPAEGATIVEQIPQQTQEVEKTEFSVILTGFADTKKVGVIKTVRPHTGLSLLDAKRFVEAGGTIKEGLNKTEAETLKKEIEEAGGEVKIE